MIDTGGGVTIAELVDSLAVTPMTIWRDLKQLEEDGLLRRVRGGAARVGMNTAFPARLSSAAVESKPFKSAIARAAVNRFVTDRQSLFVCGGTTTAECMAFLPTGARVLTNSLTILLRAMGSQTDGDVQCTGGILNLQTGSFHGPDARRFIRAKHADLFLLSCDGLDINRGITDMDTLGVEVKQEMASRASKSILLADASKLEKVFTEQVLPMDSIDCLVTDSRAPKPLLKALGQVFEVVTVDI